MHREINNHRTALAFMAGQMHSKGDPEGAKHVQHLIEVRDEAEDAR
jgi:hypothetical protein